MCRLYIAFGFHEIHACNKTCLEIMGSFFSLLGGRGGTPDPVTGLTTRENKLIQNSYSKLMENAIESGMAIMIKLFEKHPQYKKLFPFRDVPDDKLKDSASFKVHCSRIMYNLREVVDNLDDGELVVAMLDKIATNHKKHKAPAQGFHDIKVVIADIISSLFRQILWTPGRNCWTWRWVIFRSNYLKSVVLSVYLYL
ncbi:hypothetical protein WA026_000059 [Henosepilachna vigintioctopunctata]|uniref:Globin domain-containing protein n=1 Tax=Henosepilachna vigintioctopunctata TaxID=420089 RepID=A0AAW1V300_9CUCU